MKYLGEGFYYRVYEADEDRVFKKFQPYWFSFKKIYEELLKTFWSHGFHDKTFKLQPNYGVGEGGEIMCVDFGECVFTKEQALQSILSKKWLSRGSYKNWKDEVLKKYYTEQMEQVMTKNNLDSTWVSSVGNL